MAGGYGFEFDYGCGYDGGLVFLPGRRPAEVGVLEKTVRLLSFRGMTSCNEVIPNAENGVVAIVSYNRTLRREYARMSIRSGDF